MKNYSLKPLPRPNYLQNKISPSQDTKKVLKLAMEIKVLNEQTEYIKKQGLTSADLSKLSSKKINII